MPADKPKVGTGRRRQGKDTDPERADESRRSLERAIERETDAEVDTEHERGWQPGARGEAEPHRRAKPGTRRDIEEADLDVESGKAQSQRERSKDE